MDDRPEAGDFIQRLTKDAPQLFKDNLELAKAELKPAAKAAGIGSGMFGGAGFFLLRGLALLFYAAVFAIAVMFNQLAGRSALTSLALAFLIVGVVVVLIAAVLAVIGRGQFKKVKAPTSAMEEFGKTMSALSTGLEQGRHAVTADVTDRAALKATTRQAADLDTPED